MGDVTTTTVLDPLLKVRQKKLIDQFENANPLNKMVSKKFGTEASGGRSVEIPFRTAPNHSYAGVYGDGGGWATSSTGEYTNVTIPVYAHNATGKFGALGAMRTKKDVQSASTMVDRVTTDTIDGFARQMNIEKFLDGTGVRGRVDGTPTIAAGTIVVDTEAIAQTAATSVYGTRTMPINGHYQFTSDRTLSKPDRLSTAQLTGWSTLTGTFVGGIQDVADNDWIVPQRCLNNVTEGLCSVNDTMKTTYLGKNRTTAGNEYFKATHATSVGAGSIEEAVWSAYMRADEGIGNPGTMGFLRHQTLLRLFTVDGKPDRTFMKSDGSNRKYALGFASVDVETSAGGNISFFVDKDAHGDPVATSDGMIIIINPDDWMHVQANEAGWYKNPGTGSITHEVPGTYTLAVNWHHVFNMVCERPQAQLFIEGITD